MDSINLKELILKKAFNSNCKLINNYSKCLKYNNDNNLN